MKHACCLMLLALIGATVGCAEGPLWRLGQLSPWAREKWAAEEKIADTLFDPFVSGSGGHGLGLALVSDVVRGHGGRVSVRDHQPGACFRIDLP